MKNVGIVHYAAG